MPASAPSVETVNALIRLGGGALDLWMHLWASAGDDDITFQTNADIEAATGKKVRWIQTTAGALRDAGFLVGGSGMWKVMIPQCSGQVQKCANAQIPAPAPADSCADAQIPAPAETAPPSLTLSPPVCVCETHVVHTVVDVTGERENDASPPHTAPPSSPARRKRAAAEDYPTEFQALWQAYPHFNGRSDKRKSLAKWRSLSAEDRDAAAANLPAWTASHDWTRDGGQFVPGMERWLGGTGIRFSPAPAASVARTPKVGGYTAEELLGDDWQLLVNGGRRDRGRNSQSPRTAESGVDGTGNRSGADHDLSRDAGRSPARLGDGRGEVAHR